MRLWRTRAVTATALAAALAGCATPAPQAGGGSPLRLRANTAAIESAPLLLAARDHFPGGLPVEHGAIPNLVGAAAVPGVFAAGPADVATHAETQALRYSLAHPGIRIILTLTEAEYRVVARKSAGIATIADLAGKRVATLPGTSAAYFLHRMLAAGGVDPGAVTVVSVPVAEMATRIAQGEVDAVAIWDPYGERAMQALGKDGIGFADPRVYREIYNLNTTADRLADPQLRAEMVKLVRAVITASAAMARDPAAAQALVAQTTGFPVSEIVAAWPHLRFPAALPADLLDVMVLEERWLAQGEGRAARPRDELARLIDRSVLAEAIAPPEDPTDGSE